MRPTAPFFAAVLLGFTVSACGADNPPGTISQDDLPGNVKVDKVRHDDQAGQVLCPDVNNAEDNEVMTPSENYDKDRRAAVAYELSGGDHEDVSNSVWRLSNPQGAVEKVAAGLDACVKDQPEVYARFDVPGYPDALGYTETGINDARSYTRRILLPLSDRVVIVTTAREGGDDLSVAPEDLLKKAVAASEDAPKA